MKHTKNFKYRYDEQDGIFVRSDEISVNWFVSQILGKEDAQVTKISDEDVQRLLFLLDNSELRMPDGKHGLVWLREQLNGKHEMSKSKDSKAWEIVSERYRFILEQIDMTLIKSKDYDEKIKIITEKEPDKKRSPNNMSVSFEPL